MMGHNGSADVDLEVVNKGNYSFTSSDLVPLNKTPGLYYLYMIVENEKLINADGYDKRSLITATSSNNVSIYIK